MVSQVALARIGFEQRSSTSTSPQSRVRSSCFGHTLLRVDNRYHVLARQRPAGEDGVFTSQITTETVNHQIKAQGILLHTGPLRTESLIHESPCQGLRINSCHEPSIATIVASISATLETSTFHVATPPPPSQHHHRPRRATHIFAHIRHRANYYHPGPLPSVPRKDMAGGIMKALKFESSIIEAMDRLKQQERTVLEEEERAEEYFVAAKEALEKAERLKERVAGQAERNLELISQRRRSLELATSSEDPANVGRLLIPLDLEFAGNPEIIPRAVSPLPPTQISLKERARKDNRKGMARPVNVVSALRGGQTSRMFDTRDMLPSKARERNRADSVASVDTESLESIDGNDERERQTSVNPDDGPAEATNLVSPQIFRARSESLLSEIAVFRPSTPTEVEKTDNKESTIPAPSVGAPSVLDEDEAFPPSIEAKSADDNSDSQSDMVPSSNRRDASLESTWATSEGEGLFVSEARRPRVVLAEGTIVGHGKESSLPTPRSQSPVLNVQPGPVKGASGKPQTPKRKRKRNVEDTSSLPPPPTPTPRPKKKRKADQTKV
ncbi:hypothetical protein TI39_contig742g00010 [Zymoseptoria brevis]|uniref:Uncharacterized protein n=1 Tax=Zymoseptoria brevis TaxID=1047168 RepID=A0A0F4GFI8_9PEZI|nr:hypothetical protein TI39_contig742g00010 [Zymoseptoria brevis]